MPRFGKLGRLPVRHDPRTLRLRDYLPRALPPPPASAQWDHGIVNWGMMGNDRIGDCTCAAIGHAIQMATANTASEITLPDAQIIAAYSAITGYNPVTGANDNGANELDVLRYWQTVGVGGHKAVAYAACDIADQADIEDCINLFGFAYIGFLVPASAEQQFGANQPWDVVANDGGIVGGHAVIPVAYDAQGVTVVTWGRLQRMSWAFWRKYVEEAYGVVLPEWIAQNGYSPSRLNLQQLLADVQQLTQPPDPTPPTPTPPTPTPPPMPDPLAAQALYWQMNAAAGTYGQYMGGDVANAKANEDTIAGYAQQVAAYLHSLGTAKPGSLPEPPPVRGM